MCSISLATATTTNASNFLSSIPKPHKNISSPHRHQTKLVVFAAGNKLGNWYQIKLDKLIAENPKLTLSKIKDRKLSPEYNEGKRPEEPLAKAPHVILWKSTTFHGDDVGTTLSSSLSLKPNLSLQIGKEEYKERFSHMVLVRNLEPLTKDNEVESTVNIKESTCQTKKVDQAYGDNKCLRNLDSTSEMENLATSNLDQSQESKDVSVDSVTELSSDATLQGRPKRLDQPVKEMVGIGGKNTKIENLIPYFTTNEDLRPGMLLKDNEDTDWRRAQDMIKTTGRGEVELISCSTQGFADSCHTDILPLSGSF